MTDILAYAVADLHVRERRDRGPWTAVPNVRGDDLHNLSQVVSLCLKDHVPLLSAGDNLDGPDPDPDTIAALYDVLRPLDKASLPLVYILGNHERRRDWLKPFGDYAVHVHDRVITVDVNGRLVTVTGLDYEHHDAFETKVKTTRAADIGLYHQTWQEFCSGGGRTSVDLIPNNRLSIAGDVHVRKLIERAGRGPVLSPGSLTPQSVVEFMPPAVFAVKSDFSVQEIPLRGRKFVSLVVADKTTADRALTTVAGLKCDTDDSYSLIANNYTGCRSLTLFPFVSIRLDPDLPGADEFVKNVTTVNAGVNVRIDRTRLKPREQLTSPSVAAVSKQGSTPTSRLTDAIMTSPGATASARELAATLVASAGPDAVLVEAKKRIGRCEHLPRSNSTISAGSPT